MVRPRARRYGDLDAGFVPRDRCSHVDCARGAIDPGVAPAPADESVGSRVDGRHLGPPPQLRRDRTLATSRAMVLHLAENLDIPLRERNPLLLAAGYAPTYQATDFAAPEMASVRDAVERLLAAHDPYPAILVDRRWQLVSANAAAAVLVEGVDPGLLAPPCNVL